MNPPSRFKARRALQLGLFALAAFLLPLISALAAERPLTDADIERWLPRLRAEAAAFTKTVQEGRMTSEDIASRAAEREEFYAGISSGKVDALAWIRAHSRFAVTPAGAIYNADCSRGASLDKATPTALFTFGKESPYCDLLRRAASGDDDARDEFHTRRGEEETKGRSADAQAVNDFTAGVAAFYRDRGFVDSEGPTASILTTVLLAPDRSVVVWVSEANYYCGLLPRSVPPACSSLPTGPIVEIVFEGGSGEDAEEAAEAAAGGAGAAPAAAAGAAATVGGEAGKAAHADAAAQGEAAAGADEDEYVRIKEALLLARIDADNPEQLEVAIPADAPPEAKAEMAAVVAEFAVRKANLLVYRRHEAKLAPVLDALLHLSQE